MNTQQAMDYILRTSLNAPETVVDYYDSALGRRQKRVATYAEKQEVGAYIAEMMAMRTLGYNPEAREYPLFGEQALSTYCHARTSVPDGWRCEVNRENLAADRRGYYRCPGSRCKIVLVAPSGEQFVWSAVNAFHTAEFLLTQQPPPQQVEQLTN